MAIFILPPALAGGTRLEIYLALARTKKSFIKIGSLELHNG